MAVYEFYIQNYMWDNVLQTSEALFQTVPFEGTPVITEPKIRNELGKAGSFEFGMEMTSPYYNALLQMKTIMRVTYFGQTIFRGRVLTIDKAMARKRTVHCEGDFAFLLDSHQIGTKEDTRPKIGVLAYLQQIISQHNTDMGSDNIKKFTLGKVPGQYSGVPAEQQVNIPSDKAEQQFGDTSWNTSMDRIESLLSSFGGYFRTRFVKGIGGAADVTYLDWFDKYYNATTNTQTIEITKNLIDISGPTEVENLFTVVIPIGKNDNDNVYISDYWPIAYSGHSKVDYIEVPELVSCGLYSDSELNADYHRKVDYQNAISRFGRIWKPVEFENANTPEKLFGYVKDWIKNNYMAEITQWSVTALDMKVVDSSNQVLLCGDRVTVVHPEVDTTYSGMTIISADYDPYNPDKNKYVIGIPNQQINAAYGVKNPSKSGKGGGGGGGGGGISNQNNETEDDTAAQLEKLKKNLQYQYSLKTDWGQDILLDNPTAYLVYNTDGTEKDKKAVAKDVFDLSNSLMMTRTTKYAEISAEALRRGVSVNDTQLLIDYTPSEKRKQMQFKAATQSYMVNTLGLTLQESDVLVNETAGESVLASWVDDNGNWTQKAYEQGILVRANPEKIKEMAINTRKILSGEKQQGNAAVINSAMDWLTGMNLNVGGDALVSFTENLTSQGTEWVKKNVGILQDHLTPLFSGNNTASGGLEFNLESDTANVDGKAGGGGVLLGTTAKTGKYSGWDVALNKTFTYTVTQSGQTHTYTVPAKSLAADDVHFTAKYDSLRAKMLVVDNLLADYAQINTLVALKATVDTIDANYITAAAINATSVQAAIGQMSFLSVNGLSSQGGISARNGVSCGSLTVNGRTMYVQSAAVSSDGTVLTIGMVDGSSINFNKGGSYNQGWNDCIDAAQLVTRYTRNTGTYGGSTVHYILQYGQYTNVGANWYKTSQANAYTLPDPK